MVFDDEALKSLVVSALRLHPSLVVCLKFVECNAFGLPTITKQS